MTALVRVRFTSVAVADIGELGAWIRRDSESAGDRFEAAVRSTANGLLAFPNAGARLGFGIGAIHDSRWVRVTGFANHLIVYRVDGESIEIVRVLHGSRDMQSLRGEG